MKKWLALVLVLCTLSSLLLAPAYADEPEPELSQQAAEAMEAVSETIRSMGGEVWRQVREYFDSHETGEIAKNLHTIFRETEGMSDDELRALIQTTGEQLSLSLSDGQADALIKLCRRLEKMDEEKLKKQVESWKKLLPSLEDIQSALERLSETGEAVERTAEEAQGILSVVVELVRQVGRFFYGLLKG